MTQYNNIFITLLFEPIVSRTVLLFKTVFNVGCKYSSLQTDFIVLGMGLFGHSKRYYSIFSGTLHILHKPSL